MIAPALRAPASLEADLDRALRERRGRATTLELPAPPGAAHRLFDGEETEAAYYEAAPDLLLVGLGAARVVESAGPSRFGAVREALDPALTALRAQSRGLSSPGETLALGGFAFEEVLPEPTPWGAFGAARFVVPRWLYRRHGRGAALVRVLEGDETTSELLEEHAGLVARLSEAEGQPSLRATAAEGEIDRALAFEIEGARSLIRDRVLEKVVLARRRRYTLAEPVSPSVVLDRLGAPAPGLVRFGYRVGREAFLGSTPERLVSKRGRRVETEAMAGSVVWEDDATEQSLLESAKDRAEQDFVLRHVRAVLEGLSPKVQASEPPRIKRLAHVGHLVTRLSAEVEASVHLLEVARRLHPTPAVAGTPSEAARAHIAAREGFARGWYAGAVGWFDADGDGELRVALRSGRLAGRAVELYAGAGIVADSDPRRELLEIESKLRVMKEAIGAER